MSTVKFLGPSVLRVMDDFDAMELKKSMCKKAENEIVLSRTGAMLSMAEIHLDRPAARMQSQQSIKRQNTGMSLRELFQ